RAVGIEPFGVFGGLKLPPTGCIERGTKCLTRGSWLCDAEGRCGGNRALVWEASMERKSHGRRGIWMPTPDRGHGTRRLVLLIPAVLLVISHAAFMAAARDDSDSAKAFIDAGEFGPALDF